MEPLRLSIMPGQLPADVIEGCVDKGEKSNQGGLLQGQGDTLLSSLGWEPIGSDGHC
jgi:hypothetical protein